VVSLSSLEEQLMSVQVKVYGFNQKHITYASVLTHDIRDFKILLLRTIWCAVRVTAELTIQAALL